MSTITLQQAQAELSSLIHGLGPGDEVVITENNLPVAKIVSSIPPRSQRQLGSMSGTVVHMAADFDAPLEEFRDCVQ